MARSRNIKPGLFKNEVLGVADPIYTLLFEGLWVLADREGRVEDRPLRIKGEIFPYREGLNVDEMLDWLQANGFIRRYVSRGKKCIVVCEFIKHQNPHKNESDSELPAPEDEKATPEQIGGTSEFIGSARADSLSSDSLSSDSLKEETPDKPARPSRAAKTLKTYLDECKVAAVKPIPDDHFIRTYFVDVGINEDMAALAWVRFREEHTTGTRKLKKYADWPAAFANSVKDRWYKLWVVNSNGDADWTPAGLQERRAQEARQEAKRTQQ